MATSGPLNCVWYHDNKIHIELKDNLMQINNLFSVQDSQDIAGSRLQSSPVDIMSNTPTEICSEPPVGSLAWILAQRELDEEKHRRWQREQEHHAAGLPFASLFRSVESKGSSCRGDDGLHLHVSDCDADSNHWETNAGEWATDSEGESGEEDDWGDGYHMSDRGQCGPHWSRNKDALKEDFSDWFLDDALPIAGALVIARDGSDTTKWKQFTVFRSVQAFARWYDTVPLQRRHCHEVYHRLQPQKIRFDFDDPKLIDISREEYVHVVADALAMTLHELWGIEDASIIYEDASTPQKFSFHIKVAGWILPGCDQLKDFTDVLEDRLEPLLEHRVHDMKLDRSVCNKWGCFRVAGSIKRQEEYDPRRVMRIMSGHTLEDSLTTNTNGCQMLDSRPLTAAQADVPGGGWRGEQERRSERDAARNDVGTAMDALLLEEVRAIIVTALPDFFAAQRIKFTRERAVFFERTHSSYCTICHAVHDTFSPMCFVSRDGRVGLCCSRYKAKGRKVVGKGGNIQWIGWISNGNREPHRLDNNLGVLSSYASGKMKNENTKVCRKTEGGCLVNPKTTHPQENAVVGKFTSYRLNGHIVFHCDICQQGKMVSSLSGADVLRELLREIQQGNIVPPYQGWLEGLREKYNITEYTTTWREGMRPYPTKSTLAVSGQCGMSKTTTALDYVVENAKHPFSERLQRILIVSPRKSLSEQLLKDLIDRGLDFKYYMNEPQGDIFADRIIVSPESLHRVHNKVFDLIILDEVEMIHNILSGSTMKHSTLIKVLNRTISRSERVIAMDAMLFTDVVEWLAALRPESRDPTSIHGMQDPLEIIINHGKTNSDDTFYLQPCYGSWTDGIRQALKDKKRICVASTSPTRLRLLKKLIMREFPSLKIDHYDANTDDGEDLRNSTEAWKDTDVLLYTPKICVGTNYSPAVPTFDVYFAWFEIRSNVGVMACMQMLRRVREVKDHRYVVGFDIPGQSEHNLPPNILELEEYLATHKNLSSLPFGALMSLKLRDPGKSWSVLDRISLWNIYHHVVSDSYFHVTLMGLILQTGATIVILDPIVVSDKRKVKEAVDDERISGIVGAPVLSHLEFEALNRQQRVQSLETQERYAMTKYKIKQHYRGQDGESWPEEAVTSTFVKKYEERTTAWTVYTKRQVMINRGTTPVRDFMTELQERMTYRNPLGDNALDRVENNDWLQQRMAVDLLRLVGFEWLDDKRLLSQDDVMENLDRVRDYLTTNWKVLEVLFPSRSAWKNKTIGDLRAIMFKVNVVVKSQWELKIISKDNPTKQKSRKRTRGNYVVTETGVFNSEGTPHNHTWKSGTIGLS